jgi:hypothetical protein
MLSRAGKARGRHLPGPRPQDRAIANVHAPTRLTPAEPSSPPGEGVAAYLLGGGRVVLLPLEAGDVVLAHGLVGVALVRI